MIFGDNSLVYTNLEAQHSNDDRFRLAFMNAIPNQQAKRGAERVSSNTVVLEIGAGTVVPSIRDAAETMANESQCLIRINPSRSECADLLLSGPSNSKIAAKYCPLVARSAEALAALADKLGL